MYNLVYYKFDSGGPLWYRSTKEQRLFHIGLVSYGDGCGSPKAAVNTRTTEYLKWIENYTGILCRRSIA